MAGRRVNVADLLGKPAAPAENRDFEGASDSSGPDRLIYVKTARLAPNPHNPRDGVGDLSDLSSIAEIQRQSLLVVTRAAYLLLYPDEAEQLRGSDFIVVNGCRRHAAAVEFERAELACAVNDTVARSRAALLRAALDENVERKDLDPIEEAKAVMAIVAEYPTAKAAAEAEGWTGAWISQRKSLLKLHPDLQAMVRAHAAGDESGLSIRRARRLGAVKDIEELTAEQQLMRLADIERGDSAKKAAGRQSAAVDQAADANGTSEGQVQEAAEFTAVNSGARPSAAGVSAPAALGMQESRAPGAAAEFTAVNPASTADRPVPKQSAGATGTPSPTLVDLAALTIDELAQAIFSALSIDDAYRLADALATKVLESSGEG
ncbi:ParB/RepB/Spo0J family partition protein [Kitasatospora phosalacinea]|uniref:ParB/RepB/Spo0J family partition protein n=1 Tax=Kitasatospora phosalacinea TaxID=2065 RepID=UPI003659BC00